MHQIPDNLSKCFAVIFSYTLSDNLVGYKEMDQKTLNAVKDIEGYLGYEKFGDGANNVFISYWKDKEAINRWKKNTLHLSAKKKGSNWYKSYRIQITEVH